MTLTFNQYVRQQYKSIPMMKKYYGNFDKFKTNFVACNGFGGWLESLRNQTLTLRQTTSLVLTYIKYGQRKVTDLPAIFSYLSRLFNVEFPIVEGIYTVEYWQKKLKK